MGERDITPQMVEAAAKVLEESGRLIGGYQWTDLGLAKQVLKAALEPPPSKSVIMAVITPEMMDAGQIAYRNERVNDPYDANDQEVVRAVYEAMVGHPTLLIAKPPQALASDS